MAPATVPGGRQRPQGHARPVEGAKWKGSCQCGLYCCDFECVISPERLLSLYSAAFSVFGPCSSSTSYFAVR